MDRLRPRICPKREQERRQHHKHPNSRSPTTSHQQSPEQRSQEPILQSNIPTSICTRRKTISHPRRKAQRRPSTQVCTISLKHPPTLDEARRRRTPCWTGPRQRPTLVADPRPTRTRRLRQRSLERSESSATQGQGAELEAVVSEDRPGGTRMLARRHRRTREKRWSSCPRCVGSRGVNGLFLRVKHVKDTA